MWKTSAACKDLTVLFSMMFLFAFAGCCQVVWAFRATEHSLTLCHWPVQKLPAPNLIPSPYKLICSPYKFSDLVTKHFKTYLRRKLNFEARDSLVALLERQMALCCLSAAV